MPNNSLGVTPGTLLEMSETLQIPCCLPGELRGKSLVDAILEIQMKYAYEDDRPDTSDRWFRRLKCLSVYPGKEKALKRSARNPEKFSQRNYVAVSYSFESAYESLNKHTLDFEIHDLEDKSIQKVKTRDIVLERVLKYAKSDAVRCQYFWIDQECFDQNNPEEHQAAMDSMDLVYKHSDFPVALLEITFGPREVYLMGILVFCDCVWPSKDDSMVAMLRHVQTDRWWQRAWTFQEEYLASTKMDILIRHNLRRGTHIDSRLGCIEGEVCISAALFRKRSTNFLSNLIGRNTTSEELRKTCVSLRHTFHRYNETTEPDMGKAMSSIVFGDLERRKMSKSYDFLPIAANVCSYGIRLNSTLAQRSRRHSVGLCALAMYLLNGEIFFNDGRISVLPTGMGLSEYLGHISFDHFCSPSQEKTLSWLKQCRLQPERVSEEQPELLSREGVHTSGHLWRVGERIETSRWLGSSPETDDCEHFGLSECQRDRLFELMDELEQRGIYEGLWHKLDRFLRQEGPQTYARSYMNTMAGEVVRAMHCGRSLYLATLEEPSKTSEDESVSSSLNAFSSEYDSDEDEGRSEYDYQDKAFAIFVLDDHNDDVAEPDFCVFTSSSESHHVSMTVDVGLTRSERRIPLMTITGWTNGLAFYYGVPVQDTVFCWPEAWHEVQQLESRKRKR
ncbi:hypothetical protein Q7P36_002263 [Cladosporium allicinum]